MPAGSLVVAMPVNSFFPESGGAQIGLHNIATRLQARGMRPVVAIPASSWLAVRREGWQFPYPLIPLPPKLTALMAKGARVFLPLMDSYWSWLHRRFKVDVWHCTYGYPLGVSIIHYARKTGNAPHIVRCVGDDIQVDQRIKYGMRLDKSIDRQVRKWLPKADTLVAISESVAEEYRQLGVSDACIERIPNGVDLQRFSRTVVNSKRVRSYYGIPTDAFLFISVGRNHPKKNIEGLIRAFSNVQGDGQLAVLLVIGPGIKDFQSLVDKLNLSHRVVLVGGTQVLAGRAVPELPSQEILELCKSADAFVFPSFIETFGIAIVEAMAAGLPVVTTNVPGCRDIVRGGEDGLCVSPEVNALSSAMNTLLSDVALRKTLAARAKDRAASFSWDQVVDSYVELYRKVMSADSRNIH